MQEQVAKAAGGFFEAMRSQPMALALVVSNFALIGYLYYEGSSLNAERKAERELLYQNRREVAVLLARCNWPHSLPLPKDFNEP